MKNKASQHFQQRQSENHQRKPMHPITPAKMLGMAALLLQSEIQSAIAAEANAYIRRFGALNTDTATATNGNITTVVTVESNHISQDYCPFGDYFGCAQINIAYFNQTTGATLGSMTFGVNLQSTKHLNSKGQSVNSADPATLLYARNCLQDADTYISLFNRTAAAMVAQFAANQLSLPCGFVTPQNKNMYASIFTNDMPAQLCSILQGALNGITISCVTNASNQAAKLYGLIALIAIPVIGFGVLGYNKYKTGSFLPCCNRNSEREPIMFTGNRLPSLGSNA